MLDYYVEKYKIMKLNGYFQTISKPHFEKYTSESILKSLSNINNLVFEITRNCNLSCVYCINGSLYSSQIPTKEKSLTFNDLKATIDYLSPLWNSNYNKSPFHAVSIGFYGGEPLLKYSLIKEFVEYCKSLNLKRSFNFSMTTNAILLKEYIDFFVENNFNITISLDGDEIGHSYRIFRDGKNSFKSVYDTLKYIMGKYPNFWKTNISFNSVLHNRNSVNSIHEFIYNEFNKIPAIHSLNNSGVRYEMLSIFNKMYRSYDYSDRSKSSNLMQKRFTSDSRILNLCKFLLRYSRDQYFDYESLLYSSNVEINSSTGTCFPFSRKIYISSDRNILVCEKINHKYSLGRINGNGSFSLDLDYIAKKYNSLYEKMFANCKSCYMLNGCSQCIFQLDSLDSDKPICWLHKSERQMIDYIRYYIDLLEDGNIEYEKILNNCVLS